MYYVKLMSKEVMATTATSMILRKNLVSPRDLIFTPSRREYNDQLN